METHFWSMVVDGVGLLICGATLWFLRGSTRMVEVVRGGDFSCSVRQALSHQCAEEALARIAAAVSEAHRLLCGEGADGMMNEAASAVDGAALQWSPDTRDRMGAITGSGSDYGPVVHGGDPYSEATRLADRGLPAAVIARRVGLPEAELDLIVRLRCDGRGGEKIAPVPGAGAPAGRGGRRADESHCAI